MSCVDSIPQFKPTHESYFIDTIEEIYVEESVRDTDLGCALTLDFTVVDAPRDLDVQKRSI